jgi:hypothetical protein
MKRKLIVLVVIGAALGAALGLHRMIKPVPA